MWPVQEIWSFMDTENELLYLQKRDTKPSLEPDEYSPNSCTQFMIHFNIILSYMQVVPFLYKSCLKFHIFLVSNLYHPLWTNQTVFGNKC